jgi:Fe2+ or Zn2+ uptake regulation protein
MNPLVDKANRSRLDGMNDSDPTLKGAGSQGSPGESGEERARALLETRGLHATHPRRVLLAMLTEVTGHPSPDAIIRELDRRGESLPAATVYQNLQILTLHGLLNRFLDSQGLSRFDAESVPHSHLICTACGSVENVVEEHEDLWVDASKLCSAPTGQWEIKQGSMHIFGLCPFCRSENT